MVLFNNIPYKRMRLTSKENLTKRFSEKYKCMHLTTRLYDIIFRNTWITYQCVVCVVSKIKQWLNNDVITSVLHNLQYAIDNQPFSCFIKCCSVKCLCLHPHHDVIDTRRSTHRRDSDRDFTSILKQLHNDIASNT